MLIAGILLLTASCSKYVAQTYYKGQQTIGQETNETICRAKIAEKGPGKYPECEGVIIDQHQSH